MNSTDFIKRRPITSWFLIGSALSFLIQFFSLGFPWFELLSFDSNTVLSKIWSICTYPFAQKDLVSLIFSGLWTFSVCSVLEGVLSSLYFFVLLSVSILMTPVLGHCLNLFHPVSIYLAGFWMPLSFLTIFWGAKYPDRLIMFNFFFPLKSIWLAYITIAFVFFNFRDPITSSVMLIPCTIFFYAGKSYTSLRSVNKKNDKKFNLYINQVNQRKRKREEDEKLRRLFEDSFKK